MQKMIGQLLTITRGQEGRYPVCMECIHLLAVCEAVEEALSERMAERHIMLTKDLTLNADQSLLTELLINLVENAV